MKSRVGKKACVWQRRRPSQWWLPNSCLCVGYHGITNECLHLTARQYGEVVLPDAASGQGPGTLGQKAVTVQGGYGALFAVMVQILLRAGAIAVQVLIGATNLSLVTKFVASPGAVSRYKLSRSQEFITVQDFNYEQMSVSRCMNHYKSVLSAGVKAKTVTNNLPILSVLAFRANFNTVSVSV